MVYTLLRELQSDILKEFYNNFENDLSKPQFDHFQSWISGILNGLFEGSKISKQFSDKHKSSLTRFMSSDAWDHHELNAQRIGWASNIMSQQYMKYYPLIIDDTINVEDQDSGKSFILEHCPHCPPNLVVQLILWY